MAAFDRREFLQLSAAAIAAGAFAKSSFAQAAPLMPPVKKLKVDCYSRHLQWLRSADEVAEAALEMGFDGVDITVRPYPGHVDPEKVATDLPPFVETIRKHGLQVVTMTCPITDADSPNAEKMLQTASSLGLTHYWWGTFRYDQTKPVMEQLDALKPRVEKLAALNAKYKMKAMYHTYSGAGTVGAAIWDFLYVLKSFDPAHVGFHYDVGHMTNAGGNGTWELNLRAAGPYIAGVSAKDSIYEINIPTEGGGPFTGTPASLNTRGGGGFGGPGGPGGPGAGGPGGPGGPGGAGSPAGPGAAGAGGAGGANRPAPVSAAAEQEANERGLAAPNAAGAPAAQGAIAAGGAPGAAAAGGPPGAGGGRGGGRGGAGGAGGGGGGRGGGGAPAAPDPRGGGGQPNPWKVRQVPLGQGMDNLPMLATILKEINFSGPIEVQAEYPNGGAENAQDKITLPRTLVLGAMKRDLLALKAGFKASGLL